MDLANSDYQRQLEILKATVQVLVNDQAYLYALLMRRTHQDEAMIPVTQEVFEKWQSEWKKETAHNIRIMLGEEDGTPYDFS